MKTSIKAFGATVLTAGLFITALSVSAQTASTTTTTTTTDTSTCPVVRGFLKIGADNKQADVLRLQAFLQKNEGLNVDVTGTFDAKTEEAVKVFQKKYQGDILAPWDATKASGIVYVTTGKKINHLACSVPLSLSDAELGIISRYVATVNSSTTPTVAVTVTPTPVTIVPTDSQLVGPAIPVIPGTDQTAGAGDVMPIADEVDVMPTNFDETDMNTTVSASLGGGSMQHKFWIYLKGLFQ